VEVSNLEFGRLRCCSIDFLMVEGIEVEKRSKLLMGLLRKLKG